MTNSKEAIPIDIQGNFKLNPDYGGGAFRRRIRLTRDGDRIFGELEDCNHGFKVALFHEGGIVTRIQPEFPRVPFTTCADSEAPLRRLIGASIEQSAKELNALADPLANCTHLLDLSLLCIAHTQCREPSVQYDVEILDQVKGISESRVWRNDHLIHHWKSREGSICWPASLCGKPMYKGFASWVEVEYSGIPHEAAFVLHKGHLVSIGRFMDVDSMAGNRAIDESQRIACYSYSPEHAAEAIRLPGTVRDFSGDLDALLKFR